MVYNKHNMVTFVCVNKHGVCEQATTTGVENLYKKCKFRKKENFEKRHSWSLLMNKETKIFIHVFAKNAGRAQSINKYELPPPIDTDLFYGKIAIIASKDKENAEGMDLTVMMWDKIYEKLMGGFEDLDKDEDTSEEEYIPPEDRTKQGYSKATNFVVDDGVVDYNSSSSSPEEEEYEFSDADSEGGDHEEVVYEGAVNDEEEVPPESGKNQYIGENSDDELEDVELTDPHSELSEEEYEEEEAAKEN